MSDYIEIPPCPPEVKQTLSKHPRKGWHGPWPLYRDVLMGNGNYGPYKPYTTHRDQFTKAPITVEYHDRVVDNIGSCGRGICSTSGQEIDSITPAIIQFRQEKMRQQMLRDENLLNEFLSKKMGCVLAYSHVLPYRKGL